MRMRGSGKRSVNDTPSSENLERKPKHFYAMSTFGFGLRSAELIPLTVALKCVYVSSILLLRLLLSIILPLNPPPPPLQPSSEYLSLDCSTHPDNKQIIKEQVMLQGAIKLCKGPGAYSGGGG